MRPDAVEWLAAAAMGLCVAGGYLFFSLGMRAGVSPVTAAIVSNVEPILNPTWCFVFRGENPGALSIAGAVVVLGAVTVYTVVGMRGAKRVQSDHDGRKQER